MIRYYEAYIDPSSRNPRREIVRVDATNVWNRIYYVTGSVQFTYWGKEYDRPLMGVEVGVPVQLIRDLTHEIPPALRGMP